MKVLAESLASLRWVMLWVLGFSFFINLLLLVPAIYMMQVYDRVLMSRNLTTLLVLTGVVLLLFGLMAALDWIRARVLVRAGVILDGKLGGSAFHAMFKSAVAQRDMDGRQALADLATIRHFVTGKGIIALFDAPWVPIYLAVLFLLHPLIGWISTGGALVLLTLALVNESMTQPALVTAGQLNAATSRKVGSHLANAEVVEAMGMLKGLQSRWRNEHRKVLALQANASDRAAVIVALTKFVRISLQSGILGVGAYLVITGELTAGAMIAASILMGRAVAPVEGAIANWRGVVSTREARDRLENLLSAFPVGNESMRLARPEGRIELQGVDVIPPGSEQPTLRGISFAVPAGECLVVVGPSGSGKSTLARVLVGIWPTSEGAARLDGAELYSWDKEQLGPWLGYLPQDVELFDGTVAENISRFGELDSEAVLEAAARAGIHELILQWPEGYDTQIGSGGSILSGGQKQRLGLARALYGEPSLVVLDEPNSNLDDLGEMALLNAITQLKAARKTVVLITHRRNAVSLADWLLILRDGKVQTFGKKEKVLEAMQQAAAQLGVVAQDGRVRGL